MQALTLTPSSSMNATNCELVYLEPQVIDIKLALKQHALYQQRLTELGFKVTCLPANIDLPDSSFVEDPVVVLDELAVLTLPFSQSRKGEVLNIEPSIQELRQIKRIIAPGTLEGGDVLRIGQTLFVGLSTQTNASGLAQFKEFTEPFGYQVVPVNVTGALHLKTAVTALDKETLIINRAWLDAAPFSNFNLIDVPESEQFAGNLISVNGKVLMHSGFVQTRGLVEERGFKVLSLDISEFLKAEAGVTCLSVLIGN